MSNQLTGNGRLYDLHQTFERRPFKVCDKIQVFGKSRSVVTPAEGRASLENKARAFGTGVNMLEKDKLEKLGAMDMSFGACFHLFSL
jgi:hypothetical protein